LTSSGPKHDGEARQMFVSFGPTQYKAYADAKADAKADADAAAKVAVEKAALAKAAADKVEEEKAAAQPSKATLMSAATAEAEAAAADGEWKAALERAAAAKTGGTTPAKTFYDMTRKTWNSWTFSLVSALVPLLLFGSAVWLADILIGEPSHPTELRNNSETTQLPLAAFCGSSDSHGPLLNSVFAATIHFAATHAVLGITCLFAIVIAMASARNVLNPHGLQGGWAVWLVLPAILGAGVFFELQAWVGSPIGELLDRLFSIAGPDSCVVLSGATTIKQAIDGWTWCGALGVSVAVSSLVVAAACFAFRFETGDPNGAWSDSYVLRHKLNSLLTVFFAASILLVVINVALTSAMDWSGAVVDAVTNSKSDKAQTIPATAPGHHAKAATGSATGDDTGSNADSPAAGSIKSLRSSVVTFAGILGSLMLVVIFVPALYALTADIELAGKCHGLKDSPGPPPPPVAGWKDVQDWKEKHGLKLSFTDLTGSFIAVLAPILSTSLIDLTKIAVGSG
jgi:hypothetical protein